MFMCIIANLLHIPPDIVWMRQALTVAGGNGKGTRTDQLLSPHGICLDSDGSILIADYENNRIVEWGFDETCRVIAGASGKGSSKNQLNFPVDVIIDGKTNSLIISDRENRRIIKWPRQNGKSGEILIKDIYCCGLAMDNQGYLYFSDTEHHEIKRYLMGNMKQWEVVAGGNKQGNGYHQLNLPTFICVDNDQSVYVSDTQNHRIMKWPSGAQEGIVVAGGSGAGNDRKQLSSPRGLFIDQSKTLYVADTDNQRIMRWKEGIAEGEVIAGFNGIGESGSQLQNPVALAFDRNYNLYVTDLGNARIQRFATKSMN